MPTEVIGRGLTVWDYSIIVVYGLAVLGIGWWCSRRQTSTEEYFLGGRKMGWLIVGLSTMATLVSTITYLTIPGEIIKNGPGVLWSHVSVFAAFFVVGYLIIPRIMAHNIVSGYELLERQFGNGIRQAAAVLFLLIRLAWAGLVVYTCSIALTAMTGWPLEYILLGVGIVTTIYTVMGGIRAVLITDATQAVILFGGAILVVLFAMHDSHSVIGWWPNLSDSGTSVMLNWPHVPAFPTALSQRITISSVILMYFIWWVATASSDQMAIQRYLSTKNAATARKSFLTNAVANTLLGGMLALAGFALLGYFFKHLHLIPSLQSLNPNVGAQELQVWAGLSAHEQQFYTLTQNADKVFPWFIAHVLPPGISGLLLAALFSAAMSSISSGVNSITTVLIVDFEKLVARGLDQAAKLARAKALGIVVGAMIIAISFLQRLIQGNFMEIAQKINLFFVAPLAGLFFMAFFMKRTNKQGAWASIVVGILVGVFVAYYAEIYHWLTGKDGYISFTYTLPFSLGASLLIGYLVSLAFPPPEGCVADSLTLVDKKERASPEPGA